MSLLTVQNVTHMYGDQINFQNISFRLLQGEHVGLVGGNGAGKSTLLRLLSGHLLPDAGKLEWMPHVKLGYLQQHLDLQPGTTIMKYLQGAFAHLYDIEARMVQLAEEMSLPDAPLEPLLTRYGDMQSTLDHANFYQIHGKIEEVAAGLGILELGMERDISKLSGGQRTKLLLGKLLLEEPHVLLLDEPTNYLDDVHIQWLTHYLKSYKHAYLVVSHDEHFLNEVTQVIFHLEHQTLVRYTGNYASFLKNYELSKEQLQFAYNKQQQEINKLEKFIDKNRIRKAKQAKSREKALERMERIDRPTRAVQPHFAFDVYRQPANQVIQARHLQIGYTEALFPPIQLQVKRGEKIAIVGYNGIGKSTLLKTLLGYTAPLGGTVHFGEHVQPAYFAQEEFSSAETPLERIHSLRPDMVQKDLRRFLSMFGLTDQHIRQSLRSLSGGEQAKVRLCAMMLTASNVLVLDEPTNHLDVLAKKAFQEALSKYAGTVLLVSHEPAFYQDWVTQIWRVEDWCLSLKK
ncbi:ABC transporter ATP-binding protein [Paenibacillus selenitireducens]|uniref:ABC transporter ATP-binding protein n=1 Tax=Paenibacillus selenitireducens TaxID=1324314 RepID=A0A1T2XAI5_9BACL|nr:ABC-F family ATP-binding cassette domain-containing protein [Paenibacillus selenitireducens]OPA76858.1 ABC transporter ATP-binding protein [Paenibacillus selenitireducens]